MSNKERGNPSGEIIALEARNAALEEEKRHYQWLAESTTDLISRTPETARFCMPLRPRRSCRAMNPTNSSASPRISFFTLRI